MTTRASPPEADPAGPAALVAAAARGDKEAFSRLYEECAQKLYNFVFRSVRDPQAAEDVCQEVWVKAYQELRRLREPAAFSTWLYRIASRACVDRARKQSATPPAQELSDDLRAPPQGDPEQTALRREGERLAWEALGALPVRQHLALFLREVEQHNYREIAQILETSESAVETLLFRARRGVLDVYERLQSAMTERCGQARKAMAVVMDGEATPVQRRAVAAHVDGCQDCRFELRRLRQASATYGFLPLVPVPALLAHRVAEAVALAGVGAGAGGGMAKLLALATAKTKLATAALTLTGGLTVATMVVPADGLSLDAASSRASSGSSPEAAVEHSDAPPSSSDRATAAELLSTAPGLVTGMADSLQDVPVVGPWLASIAQQTESFAEQLLDAVEPVIEPVGGLPAPVGDVTDQIGDVDDVEGVVPPVALPTPTPPDLLAPPVPDVPALP